MTGKRTITGRRYKRVNGAFYIARDRGGRPEHAVWELGRVVWIPHSEGATMAPFDGPADVREKLCEGGMDFGLVGV